MSSEFGEGVGVFLAKKLVSGLIPRVLAFFSCLTPFDSMTLAFFFASAGALLVPPPLFFRLMPKVDDAELLASDVTEVAEEFAEREGVLALLPRPGR